MNRALGFGISKSAQSITAFWSGVQIADRGAASADLMATGQWWVSRVLIQPAENRNKGIGGQLLETLKREVKDMGAKELVVCPSGYSDEKAKQFNFYEKHGFVKSAESPEMLICAL
jgi:N-acetylglutamate synthase-like GNAT family acetyltransferase